jgi:hypothetical protein
MRIKDELTDLGLGFTLELKLKRERKKTDEVKMMQTSNGDSYLGQLLADGGDR